MRFANKLVLLLGCIIFICACAQTKQENNLTLALRGEVESLDPAFSYDGISHGLLLNVYDTLIKFKGSSLKEFEPLIAREVPSLENGLISPDGLTYTFNIREGITFQDGTPLTAQDVAYSLQRFMLSDNISGPSSLLLEPILGISSTRDKDRKLQIDIKDILNAVQVKDNQVIIKLKRPFAPFLGIMARWSYVLNKKWAIEHGEWDPSKPNWKEFNNRDKDASFLFENTNGSGPFIVQRWDRAAKRVYLTANKNYFLGAPKLDSVLVLSIPEQSTMRLMLESGDVDIAEIAGSFVDQIASNPEIVVYDTLPRLKTDPVLFFTYDINGISNPDIGSGKLDGQGIPTDFFKDINIRKAFLYSFDYDAFVKDSAKNKAPRAVGAVPPALSGYDENMPHYNLDLKKAEEYFKLAKNGEVWDKGFSFTITYSSGNTLGQMACEILKRNVEKINPKFKIELRAVPWANFLEKTQNHKMPLWVRGWVADYPDAHNFAFPFLHSNGRYAIAQNFKDATLDKFIEEAVSTTDPKKREELYKKIGRLDYESAGRMYTIYSPGVWVMRKNVQGFVDNPVFMGIYFYPLYKVL